MIQGVVVIVRHRRPEERGVTARDLAGDTAAVSVDFSVDTNIFSPTGPFGIFLLLNVIVAAVVVTAAGVTLYLRRRGRRS